MVSSALTGVPQSPAAASASLWIEKCLWKVRLWMLETVISYIAKSVCDEYLVYVAYEGRKKVLFQGALVYLALTDVLFAVICGVGIKQLVGTLRPLLHPKMQMLVKIRQFLFVFFYIFISMILRTLVGSYAANPFLALTSLLFLPRSHLSDNSIPPDLTHPSSLYPFQV